VNDIYFKIKNNYPLTLDSASSKHIMKSNIDTNDMNKNIKVIGFSGENTTGKLALHSLFGECIVVSSAPRNLLSLSQLHDKGWKIKYNNKKDCFSVKNDKINIVFKRNGNLYTNYDKDNNNTAFSLDIKYSDHDILKAENARRLHNICGHPNDPILKNILRKKQITKTKVSIQDIDLAKKILGPCQDCLIGKGTKYPATTSKQPRSMITGEIIHIDIMYYGPKNRKEIYLISIDEASGYVNTELLKSHESDEILNAIKKIIAFYKSYNHCIRRISSDRELGIISNKIDINLLGCVLETTSAEGHERFAERAIRNIKGKCRSIKSTIKYPFPQTFNKYLVKYTAQCINIIPASGRASSPWILVTNRSINARRHLRCGFGEVLLFASTYLTTDKSDLPRAEYGIVLGIDLESKGTKIVYLLEKKQLVYRNHFWRVQLTEDIKQALQKLGLVNQYIKPINDTDINILQNQTSKSIQNEINSREINQNQNQNEDSIQIPDVQRTQEQNSIENENNIQNIPNTLIEPVEENRYSLRRRRNNIDYRLLNDQGLVNKQTINLNGEEALFSIKEGREINLELTNNAIDAEIQQLLDQDVFEGVFYEDIGNEQILTSRFLVDRKGDKFKGRLVAGGHRQNRKEYQQWETSSPTISMQGILCMTSIAINKNSILSSVDVKGAYLFAPLKKRVYMKLPVEVSERLIELEPRFDKYIDHCGVVRVRLKKALYGLIESGNLWYNHIKDTLIDIGFKQIHSDQCMFFRDKQIIGVYVDDLLLLTQTEEEKEQLIKEIESYYPELKRSQGNSFNYRGLEFKQFDNRIEIKQEQYTKQLIEENKDIIKRIARTPATRNLFENHNNAKRLSKTEQMKYQETLAKIMWLSNQTRPDIKMVTSVLSGRVQSPSVHDQAKLQRILQYIKGTMDLGLIFTKGSLKLKAYADAAHLVHPNCHGHSGAIIKMGNNTIHTESKKQRIVSQSSTEAELVSLNSCLNNVLWLRNMLEQLGYKQGKTKMYQDNKSCITMVHNGRPTKGTKHIRMRYFHIKSKMNDGTVKIKYKKTEKMIADAFTKPIESSVIFGKFRKKILGM